MLSRKSPTKYKVKARNPQIKTTKNNTLLPRVQQLPLIRLKLTLKKKSKMLKSLRVAKKVRK